jgi:hypothetical protein
MSAAGTDPPTDIHPRLAPLSSTPSWPVAAVYAEPHGGALLIGMGQGRGVPAPALGLCKDLGAARPWGSSLLRPRRTTGMIKG